MGKQYEIFRLMNGYYRIYIYHPDHNPPHIHLKAATGGKDALIEIESLKVAANDGFKERELTYVIRYLEMRREHVLTRWKALQAGEE